MVFSFSLVSSNYVYSYLGFGGASGEVDWEVGRGGKQILHRGSSLVFERERGHTIVYYIIYRVVRLWIFFKMGGGDLSGMGGEGESGVVHFR